MRLVSWLWYVKMTSKERELWEKAVEIAPHRWSDENGGDWEAVDKYEREDFVWSIFEELKEA